MHSINYPGHSSQTAVIGFLSGGGLVMRYIDTDMARDYGNANAIISNVVMANKLNLFP